MNCAILVKICLSKFLKTVSNSNVIVFQITSVTGVTIFYYFIFFGGCCDTFAFMKETFYCLGLFAYTECKILFCFYFLSCSIPLNQNLRE